MKLRKVDLRDRFRTPALVCLAILAVIAAGFFVLRYRTLGPGFNDPSTRGGLSRNETWVGLGGHWIVGSAEVESNSEERGAKLLSRRGNWGDYQVQADVKMTSPEGVAGLIIRSSGEEEGVDSYHGYFVGISPMQTLGGIRFFTFRFQVLKRTWAGSISGLLQLVANSEWQQRCPTVG